MSEINKIIDDFFEAAAKFLIYNNIKTEFNCTLDINKLKSYPCFNKEYETIDIQEEFNKLIYNIVDELFDEDAEKESYATQYSGKELFDANIFLISSIYEAGLKEKVGESGDITDMVITDVKEWLLENNDYFPICFDIMQKDLKPKNIYHDLIDVELGEYYFIDLSKCYRIFKEITKKLKAMLPKEKMELKKYFDVGIDAYKRYFKGVFSMVSGFKEITVEGFRDATGRRFIPKHIAKDINYVIIMLMLMTKRDNDFYKKVKYSRFQLINNPVELSVVKKAIELYEIMFVSALEECIAENKDEKIFQFIESCQLIDNSGEIKIIREANVDDKLESVVVDFFNNIL